MKTMKILRAMLIAALSLTVTFGGAVGVLAEEGAAQTAVREYGVLATMSDSNENAPISIEYPVVDNEEIDGQIQTWAKGLAEDFTGEIAALKDEAEDIKGELTVSYDAYLVNERYVGVAETGMLSHSLLAHPADIVQTFNIDLVEGRLLTLEDMIPEAKREKVYELLNAAIAQIDDTAGPADETWLEQIVLTGEGLVVMMPRGEHFASALGMQRIILAYEDLSGVLGVDIAEQTAGNGDAA